MRSKLRNDCNGFLPIFIFYESEMNKRSYKPGIKFISGLDSSNLPFTEKTYLKKEEQYNNYISMLQRSGEIKKIKFAHIQHYQ